MSKFDILLEEHASSDCKECLIKAYNLGAREELEKTISDIYVKYANEKGASYFNPLLKSLEKRLRELEG